MKVVSMFASAEGNQVNLNAQDMHGRTVLHLLAKAAYDYPEKVKKLVSSFHFLTTTVNVNVKDDDLLTP